MAAAMPWAGTAGLRQWPDLCRPQRLDFRQFCSAFGVSPSAASTHLQLARAAAGTPYPPHWSEQHDIASGGVYFYHELQDESTWEHPLTSLFREVFALVQRFTAEALGPNEISEAISADLAQSQARAVEDLADWAGPLGSVDKACPLGTGVYYFNRRTAKSSWEDPRERWQYELHVRFDLLVGFYVAEERAAEERAKAAAKTEAPLLVMRRSKSSTPADVLGTTTPLLTPREHDLTPTLNTLASSLSVIAVTMDRSILSEGPEFEWLKATSSKPQQLRKRQLPLPPRSAGSTAGVLYSTNSRPSTSMSSAPVSLPPLVGRPRPGSRAGVSRPQSRCGIASPPPPPPGAPPRSPARLLE